MKIAVEAYQITDVPPSLDGITVFWQDLGITPQLKARKTDHEYLGRIIDAIKASAEAGL